MKRLIISLACSVIVSGCAVVTGATTPIEDTVKVIRTTTAPKPTIILLHGCDGMSRFPHYYLGAKEMATWGYNIVMLDSFTKRRAFSVCLQPSSTLPVERARDVEDAAKWILEQSWHTGKIGVIGYSHGGSSALNVAGEKKNTHISAAVAYYPHCGFVFVGNPYWDNKIPTQIHIGDSDTWTPSSLCIKDSWSSPLIDYRVYEYNGAVHAFDQNGPTTLVQSHKGSHLVGYDAKAAKMAASRTKEFFNKYIMN